MTRVWGARHLSSLLLAYLAAACVTPLLYASVQIGLEHLAPTPSAIRGAPSAAIDSIPAASATPVEASGAAACARLRDPLDERSCLAKEIATSRGALSSLEKRIEAGGGNQPVDRITESEKIAEQNSRMLRLAIFSAILSSFGTVAAMKIFDRLTRKRSGVPSPIDG